MISPGSARSADHFDLGCGAILEAIEDQLDARGDAELVKNAKEVIADGVFAEAQVAGNLAVGEAFGNQADDIFLALGKQAEAVRVLQMERLGVAEDVEQVAEVLAIGPDLALMHGVDALGESLERLIAEDDAVGAAAEGVNNEIAFAGGEQHDGAGSRVQFFGWRGRAGCGNYRCDRARVRGDSRLRAERIWTRGGLQFAGGVRGVFNFQFSSGENIHGRFGEHGAGFQRGVPGFGFRRCSQRRWCWSRVAVYFVDWRLAVAGCVGGGAAAGDEG